MTIMSDNEKDNNDNPEISEKEVQVKTEPEETKTEDSNMVEKPEESTIQETKPEPLEDSHDKKMDPTVEEKEPATAQEEEEDAQEIAQTSREPDPPAPESPEKKKETEVSSRHSDHDDDEDDMDDNDDHHDDVKGSPRKRDKDGEFRIPTRFTKSGRRRATPFPLKVCTTSVLATTQTCLLFVVSTRTLFGFLCFFETLKISKQEGRRWRGVLRHTIIKYSH